MLFQHIGINLSIEVLVVFLVDFWEGSICQANCLVYHTHTHTQPHTTHTATHYSHTQPHTTHTHTQLHTTHTHIHSHTLPTHTHTHSHTLPTHSYTLPTHTHSHTLPTHTATHYSHFEGTCFDCCLVYGQLYINRATCIGSWLISRYTVYVCVQHRLVSDGSYLQGKYVV